ncbi:MAG: serine/threonine-protein kinase [Archangium sp.]|nr:serine/threonine-protein kinase [Archangium sp.]
MSKYVLDHKLASGGMGEVYLARQIGPRGFQRTCVVKKMFAHHADDPEMVARFLEEARLTARLNHANIAQVYEFGKGKAGYYLAMEHVNGPSIQKLIEALGMWGEKLDVGLASMIVMQAAQALDHAHRLKSPEGEPLNLVHRDVSPANLMLSPEGVTKLIDFGIAKALTSPNWTSVHLQSGERIVRGKLAYISPEQLWGYSVDGRADLFSLGLVWYELLTLHRAIRGETDQEIVASAREWKITPLQRLRPECPPATLACVNRAMARNVTDRFQTGRDFANAVEAALAKDRLKPTQGQLQALVEQFSHTRPNVPSALTPEGVAPVFETREVTVIVPWSVEPGSNESPTDLHAALVRPEPRPDRTDEVSVLARGTPEGSAETGSHTIDVDIDIEVEPPSQAPANRLGDSLRRLGVGLVGERIAMLDLFRGALAQPATIGWVLVVEPVGTAPGKPSYAPLVGRIIDAVVDSDGALDFLDERHLRFIFIGPRAQARAVLAAQELQERVEASLDGAGADEPNCRIAIGGGHLSVTRAAPVEGAVTTAVRALASTCAPGQVLMPSRFANAINDLVLLRPAKADSIEIVGRRALRPVLPVVGRAALLAELDERVSDQGELAPFVVTGPQGAGKSVLAFELQRRARLQGFTVCATRNPPSLRAVSGGAIIELICKMADVAPSERWKWLPAALERLGISRQDCAAVLAVTNERSPSVKSTAARAVAALRLVIDAQGDGKRSWLLLFDGPEDLDPLSGEAFVELCRTARARELTVGFTTPAWAQGLEHVEAREIPPLTAEDVTEWLTALLGQEPPRDLLSTIVGRCRGVAGLMVDWALLAFDLGLLRPRGDGLVLEGEFPAIRESELPRARVRAAGSRVSRMLEATALLGDRATASSLEAVLPGADIERLLASRLVTELDGQLQVRSKEIESAARRAPCANGAGLIERASLADKTNAG